jgi:hypothetical protein
MADPAFSDGGLAVVIGAGGGIGSAVTKALDQSGCFARTMGFARTGTPAIDIANEDSVAAAAKTAQGTGLQLRLLFVASGFLHGGEFRPERALRDLSPAHMAKAFAVNAIGPALVLKHFAPLLPKANKAVIALLSAKVGSIADNRLGGWHSCRASKAALNQIVRTTAIELALSAAGDLRGIASRHGGNAVVGAVRKRRPRCAAARRGRPANAGCDRGAGASAQRWLLRLSGRRTALVAPASATLRP